MSATECHLSAIREPSESTECLWMVTDRARSPVGSGSFGHFPAASLNTWEGVPDEVCARLRSTALDCA